LSGGAKTNFAIAIGWVMLDPKKLLGNRIRHMRRKSDFSQEQLAELLGIDPNSISRIECGVHYPSMETLEKIAKTLNIKISDMFETDRAESADEMRAYLIQIASKLDEQTLLRVVKVVRQII
jgi:transcriptional regulator with XRE-family HTH domain